LWQHIPVGCYAHTQQRSIPAADLVRRGRFRSIAVQPGVATIMIIQGFGAGFCAIGPGPSAFTIDAIGGNGYTINSDGTLTNFQISPQLQEKQITYTTLPPNAER